VYLAILNTCISNGIPGAEMNRQATDVISLRDESESVQLRFKKATINSISSCRRAYEYRRSLGYR
jgi:hypothetical protein